MKVKRPHQGYNDREAAKAMILHRSLEAATNPKSPPDKKWKLGVEINGIWYDPAGWGHTEMDSGEATGGINVTLKNKVILVRNLHPITKDHLPQERAMKIDLTMVTTEEDSY